MYAYVYMLYVCAWLHECAWIYVYPNKFGKRLCAKDIKQFDKSRCLDYYESSMLKSMSVNKDFQIWHLIGWQHNRQPTRSHVRKPLVTNGFYHGFFLVTQTPGWQIYLSTGSPCVWNPLQVAKVLRYILIPTHIKDSKQYLSNTY